MLMIFGLMMIIGVVCMIMMMMGVVFSKKSLLSREKNSPFECGFDPCSSARKPFSLQFFLIAMIFLIFDVEISLLLPFGFMGGKLNMMSWTLDTLIFVVVLLLGLYYEWVEGGLDWVM